MATTPHPYRVSRARTHGSNAAERRAVSRCMNGRSASMHEGWRAEGRDTAEGAVSPFMGAVSASMEARPASTEALRHTGHASGQREHKLNRGHRCCRTGHSATDLGGVDEALRLHPHLHGPTPHHSSEDETISTSQHATHAARLVRTRPTIAPLVRRRTISTSHLPQHHNTQQNPTPPPHRILAHIAPLNGTFPIRTRPHPRIQPTVRPALSTFENAVGLQLWSVFWSKECGSC